MKKIKWHKTFCVFTISLLLLSTTARATSGDSTIEGPYNIRPLKVQLLLLTMDAFNLGAGIQADYHFKHAVVEAQWRKAMYLTLGGLPDPGDKKNMTTNTPHSFSNFEIDGEYYFADYIVMKRYTNILTRNTTSYTYNTKYGKARRIYAVKGGAFVASGFTRTDSAGAYNTNYRTMGLSFGLARKRIDKFNSNKHHDGIREIYLQLLTGGTTLDALSLKPGAGPAPKTAFKNIGWRFGGQRYGEHFYVGWEMGLRPTLINPDKFKASIPFNYALVSFGVTLYGNEKWK
jgi:hypothetical protein